MRGTVSRRGLALAGAAVGVIARVRVDPAAAQPSPAQDGAAPGSPDHAIDIISLDAMEQQAKAVLPAASYAFVAGGAGDEWTLRENRRAFSDFPVLPWRLQGVQSARISLATRLLGLDLPSPLLVNPMGLHIMVHPEAERATAAGAGRAKVLYTASGASNLPLEVIAAATPAAKWFQVYVNSDPAVTRNILLRAKVAGYSAIVLTADAIGPGTSEAFLRLGSPFPPGMTFGNNDPRYGGQGSFLMQNEAFSFDQIGAIGSLTGLPVVVKGIMRADDARDAVLAGAAAIQVSNHGGRQIDGVPASVSVLRSVVEAVQGRVPVILDSGVRRGADVFRALALGATAVGVGRPVLFAAALGGAGGVASVLRHLTAELHTVMLLAGVERASDITQDHLWRS